MTRRPRRILVGTHEIALQNIEFARGFRELGNKAYSVVDYKHPFFEDAQYDLTLNWTPRLPRFLEQATTPVLRKPKTAIKLWAPPARRMALWPRLLSYDVYVFLWGQSLAEDNRDLPLLRRLGKKIICLFLGSDVRHWSAAEPARRLAGMEAYAAYRDHVPLETKLRRLRMAELYADAIFMQPSYAELALRPYHHVYVACDPARFTESIPGRDIPRIVHAPSASELKGTKEILATLDRLREDGVQFELRLLEGRPNAEVIEELRDADVVVDELRECNYGMFALEAMASGCAVAGPNQPAVVPLPSDKPLLAITPDTVEAQLRRLLTDKDLRLELARAGRSFVERYHSPRTVAHGIERVLNGSEPEYRPGFFAWRYELPGGEVISPELQAMTWGVVQRYGLPRGVDPHDLERRKLMTIPAADADEPVPRWDSGPSLVDLPPHGEVMVAEQRRRAEGGV